MKLLIEIPDKTYRMIKNNNYDYGDMNIIIQNGTPLPKGHGDLKDMDDIYEALEGWSEDTGWIIDAIDFQVPTIIEAESEE